MTDIKQFLNEGEILSRLERYELSREEGRLFIDIYELISEVRDNKYFATPNLLIKYAKEQFIGKGASSEAALKDCLSKIKEHPINVILPDS